MDIRKFISHLLLLAVLPSCTDRSWEGVSDSDYDDYDDGTPVPVVVGMGRQSLSYTKGSGAVDAVDGREWRDVNIYVYAFRQDSDSYSSLASASGSSCLVDASVDSGGGRGGRKAWYSAEEEFLSWADSDKEIYYPSGKETYEFYAYYVDALNIPSSSVSRGSDRISFPVKIDGSSDLMTGRAVFSESVFDGSSFTEIEKGMIRRYAYSSYTARRGINPSLDFVHHLTRLRFELYPASDVANTVNINSITVKTKTSGIFTVVSRDGNVGVDFSSDRNRTPLALTESDGSPLKQETYHTDYSGDFSDALYERPHVQVGGSLLVAPDTEYEVEVSMKERRGVTYSTKTSFTINSNSGFGSGKQYAVRLAIYGMTDVRPSVSVEAWGTGGDVKLDEEDRL